MNVHCPGAATSRHPEGVFARTPGSASGISFFCLKDIYARGNLGLLDQYFALLWVKDNIESFGGNKSSITLMGHSAGAASVIYHMISPRTSGYFQRAIVMSGSVLSPWSRVEDPSKSSRAIARSLGCLAETSRTILQCLRSKSVEELLRAFEMQYKDGVDFCLLEHRSSLGPLVNLG
uniref:Carboxylic ester hydrolase n=1 Tax=Timema cristinae TaxID=61476 RepID=A0A7R9D5T7_TIMCR|nr:unnamed protein product [Timema cristinae]